VKSGNQYLIYFAVSVSQFDEAVGTDPKVLHKHPVARPDHKQFFCRLGFPQGVSINPYLKTNVDLLRRHFQHHHAMSRNLHCITSR